MRYSVKEVQTGEDAGKWAVFIGRKYFPKTVTTDKLYARFMAYEKAGQYYHSLMLKAQVEWERLNEIKGYQPDTTWGDVLS